MTYVDSSHTHQLGGPSSVHTSIGLTESGKPCVIKRAFAAKVATVTHEAAMLRLASHPGVVEFLGNHECNVDGATGIELTTGFAGSHTLDSAEPFTSGQVAGLFSALGTTVDDLHRLGITHGSIAIDHVIISRHGRPVLCSFGNAFRHDITAPDEKFRHAVATDIADLGTCLNRMIDRLNVPKSSGAGRSKARGLAAHQCAVRSLRAIAAACDGQSHGFVTAQELAQRLTTDIADACLPAEGIGAETQDAAWQRFATVHQPELATLYGPGRHPAPRSDKPATAEKSATISDAKRRKIALAGVGVAALIAMAGVIVINPNTGGTQGTLSAAGAAATTVAPTRSSSAATAVVPTTAAPTLLAPTTQSVSTTSANPLSATSELVCIAVDCPKITAPGLVTYKGDTFLLGDPSDTILLADWHCGGEITAAVFRRATGAILMFDGWATTSDIVARPIGKVANATSAFVARDSQHCPHLMVESQGEPLREIDTIGASS